MKKLFFLGLFLITGLNSSYAQAIKTDSLEKKVSDLTNFLWYRDHDSTYIQHFNEYFSIRMLAMNKYTFLNLNDNDQSTSLLYRPDLGLNVGLGMVNRWFSLDFSLNIPLGEEVIPDARSLDVQSSVFSTKFIMEGTLKYFDGHQITSIENVPVALEDEYKIRPDIRTTSIWLQFLYAFNYDRFSIKAPFVFNEIQKKSAGSLIFGVSFNMYNMAADSSIVPTPVQFYFDGELYLTNLNTLNLNVNIGYIYTLAIKRFFLTVGLIPGIGIVGGDISTEFTSPIKLELSPVVKTLGAIGINWEKWYVGGQFFGDFNGIRLGQSLTLVTGQTKSKFFLGYRFTRRKG